jgi:hypothetical protein
LTGDHDGTTEPLSGMTSISVAQHADRPGDGSCSLETRGRVVELVEPTLITDPELRPAPPHVRFVERRIAGVTQYRRMRATDRPELAG